MFQRPGTDDRKQTHYTDVIRSDRAGDQVLHCGPVVIVISPVLLIAATSDQGPWNILILDISSIAIHTKISISKNKLFCSASDYKITNHF